MLLCFGMNPSKYSMLVDTGRLLDMKHTQVTILCPVSDGVQKENYCGKEQCLAYIRKSAPPYTKTEVVRAIGNAFPSCTQYNIIKKPGKFFINIGAKTKSFTLQYGIFQFPPTTVTTITDLGAPASTVPLTTHLATGTSNADIKAHTGMARIVKRVCKRPSVTVLHGFVAAANSVPQLMFG